MKFVYDINGDNDDFVENCFLLANGLGGYCSLTVSGGNARGDHCLLMAAKRAPNVRFNMVSNVIERLEVDGVDVTGHMSLKKFVYDDFGTGGLAAPATWFYECDGIRLVKSIVMVHGENTVAIEYSLEGADTRNVKLYVLPMLTLFAKNDKFDEKRDLSQHDIIFENESVYAIPYNGKPILFFATNACIECLKPFLFSSLYGKMYFPLDERDGRQAYGDAFINHRLCFDFKSSDKMNIILGTSKYEYNDGLFKKFTLRETARKRQLADQSGLKTELGKQLVISSDAYVVRRDSTDGMSIIAGYPFFEDWGRDTMISLAGATLVTRRFGDCKSILRTFAKYEKNGLLPNLFPEGDNIPMYNSADAPLLFVNAVYEYIEYSGDVGFADEILPILRRIVDSYINGTDFHIKMDSDALIMAGDGLEQLTWMDVRVGDFLPTPRHGKPVEINAYWYSALRVMEKLDGDKAYGKLADRVKASFNEKFWNESKMCLKDVLSGNDEENQIRCNQIWALTMPFTMLDDERSKFVLEKVRKELYTTVGLRTLSMDDENFHEIYIGDMKKRDMAYHQGTVWAFPLGAYYRACLKMGLRQEVENGMNTLCKWLKEGCASQIAEIYDGKMPTVSRGCFAQAWSVCEILRAVYEMEKLD